MIFSSLLFCSLSLVLLHARRTDYTEDALGDAITSLPGLSSELMAKYTMFSGYINLAGTEKNMFYWFVESTRDPVNDPVALWTNGGPGCSGLGGFFTEQGPFRPYGNLSLYENPHTWNQLANIFYIEAPCGVGFSYSNNPKDYSTGDNQTAIDNYHLIQGWLEKFPNYMNNDFYISSESYGGHYMPTLSQQIILGNNAGGNPRINFKGVFLGNPYTDPVENSKGMYDTWYGHQLVSLPTWQNWYSACGDGTKSSLACNIAMIDMNLEVGENIDPYALDFPVCHESVSFSERFWFLKEVIAGGLKRPVPPLFQKIIDSYEKKVNLESHNDHLGDYEPCESNWMGEYLNQKSVQTAIHVELKGKSSWEMCGGIDYDRASMQVYMEPVWQWIFANDPSLRVTIVSGDDDSVCGTLGTQSWIWEMGLQTSVDWDAWTDGNGQNGGYVVKFKDGFNFVTVHSAGHMIPETQPMRSLETFNAFLQGQI